MPGGSGRLRVTHTMSTVRIEVPGEQHVLQAVYRMLGSSALLALGYIALPAQRVTPGNLLILLLMAGLLYAMLAGWVWKQLSTLLEEIQQGARASLGMLYAILLVTASALILPILGLSLPGALILAVLCGLLTALLCRLCPTPATILIEPATVTFSHQSSRHTVPLEELSPLTPARPWRSPAMLGEQPISGLAALTAEEHAWLEETLAGHAQQRRAALLREGHDLERRPATPASLVKLTER
jgi:hypothetical protein